MSEKKIDIKTPDGIADCRVFHPPGEGAWPAIILYMDAFGVRPALVAMAERLASNGYYVLLPNLFYRSGPYPAFDLAAIFKEGPERHRMMTLARSINNGLVGAIPRRSWTFSLRNHQWREPMSDASGIAWAAGSR